MSLTSSKTIFGIAPELVMAIIRDGATRNKTFADNPHGYAHIGELLVWSARGDMVKRVKENNVKKGAQGTQLEHVFEIQYFAITFQLAVSCYREFTKDQRWYPATDDIHWAMGLINSVANVQSYPKEDHALKSRYFKMGSTNDVLAADDRLIQYLEGAAKTKGTGFAALVDLYYSTLDDQKTGHQPHAPKNIVFQFGFLEILKATPWYNGGWRGIFGTASDSSNTVIFASNATDKVKNDYYEEIAENFDLGDSIFAPNAF